MEKREIRETLIELENIRKRILQSHFMDIGLTFGQGQPRILYHLLKKEHVTQKELAGMCSIDVTNMSRTLDRMEEAGLLCREKDPGCRRSFLIALTEPGREKAKLVKEGFERVDNCIWEGFQENEMDIFKENLNQIIANLNQL